AVWAGNDVLAIDTPNRVEDLAFAGNFVVSCHHRLTSAFVWSPSGNEKLAELEHPASVTAVAVTKDGTGIVTGDIDGVVRLFTWPDGRLLGTHAHHKAPVRRISTRGSWIVSSGRATVEGAQVVAWRPETGEIEVERHDEEGKFASRMSGRNVS